VELWSLIAGVGFFSRVKDTVRIHYVPIHYVKIQTQQQLSPLVDRGGGQSGHALIWFINANCPPSRQRIIHGLMAIGQLNHNIMVLQNVNYKCITVPLPIMPFEPINFTLAKVRMAQVVFC